MRLVWKDEDIIKGAQEYILSRDTLFELEDRLKIPHSTLWWNFNNRLKRLDPRLYELVVVTFKLNKQRRGRNRKNGK